MLTTMPDHPPLESLAEPRTGPAAFEDQLPGGEAGGEQTVMVKVEDFQTVSQVGTDNDTGAPDQSQLWTSGLEKRNVTEQTVCVLLHEVKYNPRSAAAAAAAGASQQQQQQQLGFSPPIKDLPFLDGKEKQEVMLSDQFSVMGMQPRSSDMTLTDELQDHDIIQQVTVSYSTVGDQTDGGAAYEFNMTTVGHHDGCGPDNTDTTQKCFICSSCGQSFGSFNLFQQHQCKSVTE